MSNNTTDGTVTLQDINSLNLEMFQAGIYGETVEEKAEREYIEYMEEHVEAISILKHTNKLRSII